MGAAEIIPGISGGTIALILGIYKRLIIAISSIDKNLLKKLLKFETLKSVVKKISSETDYSKNTI